MSTNRCDCFFCKRYHEKKIIWIKYKKPWSKFFYLINLRLVLIFKKKSERRTETQFIIHLTKLLAIRLYYTVCSQVKYTIKESALIYYFALHNIRSYNLIKNLFFTSLLKIFASAWKKITLVEFQWFQFE